jgi:hypothetical protein
MENGEQLAFPSKFNANVTRRRSESRPNSFPLILDPHSTKRWIRCFQSTAALFYNYIIHRPELLFPSDLLGCPVGHISVASVNTSPNGRFLQVRDT